MIFDLDNERIPRMSELIRHSLHKLSFVAGGKKVMLFLPLPLPLRFSIGANFRTVSLGWHGIYFPLFTLHLRLNNSSSMSLPLSPLITLISCHRPGTRM